MKKLLFLALFASVALTMNAQTTPKKITPDPMLHEVYTQEKLTSYQEESPSKLLELNYYVQSWCYVSNEKPANSKEMGDVSAVKSANYQMNMQDIIASKKINPLHFSFLQGEKQYHVYTLGNSGWYVIVYPGNIYMEKKAQYLKQYSK